MSSRKQAIKYQLHELRREYKGLVRQIEKMSSHENIADVALGVLIRKQSELKSRIKKLEDELIPDLYA